VIRLSEEHDRALEGSLPADSLAFLRDTGVPELVVFRGIDHAFTLDMEPLLDGKAFRLGSVDRGWYRMALERGTGHFGYVFSEQEHPPWVFCNTSVAQFLECFAVTERVLELEEAKQLAWAARGEYLDREIRRIDPAVFADVNNIWSFLVEEVRNGVV
jgi:SUKH-4 immunity protein